MEMAVYVDNFEISFGRMKMSHMVADSTEELLQMVDKIRVQRKWIQKAGTNLEHFDIALSKKKLAVQNGAIETDMVKLARATITRKSPNEKIMVSTGIQQGTLFS